MILLCLCLLLLEQREYTDILPTLSWLAVEGGTHESIIKINSQRTYHCPVLDCEYYHRHTH